MPATISPHQRRAGIKGATIPAAIAEVMVERHAASGACTEADLLAAGFTSREIARHAAEGKALARERQCYEITAEGHAAIAKARGEA